MTIMMMMTMIMFSTRLPYVPMDCKGSRQQAASFFCIYFIIMILFLISCVLTVAAKLQPLRILLEFLFCCVLGESPFSFGVELSCITGICVALYDFVWQMLFSSDN